MEREVSFLAGRRSFRTTDERNRPLLAERVAARVYLCSPATNNRVRLRVYFPAHGEERYQPALGFCALV